MNSYGVVYKTAAAWAAIPPGTFWLKGDSVSGQEGIESDTGRRKQGPGYWDVLPYLPVSLADVIGSLVANLNLGGHKGVNAADGTAATDLATKGQMDAAITAAVNTAVTGLLDYKGATDCSGNPNYPAASKGDMYVVSVAGKIGGASGTTVDAGDFFVAEADNAGGTEAAVGASWGHIEHNLVNAVLSTRQVATDTSMTGGGDLSADRTLAVKGPTRDSYTTAGNFTWTKPAGAVRVRVVCISSGSGGGSGRTGAAASVRNGGGGGAPGIREEAWFDAADLGSTENVTVGAGGAGGAAAGSSTNGNPGTDGATSYFGASGNRWLNAVTGTAGTGGTNSIAGIGGGAPGPGGAAGASSSSSGGAGTSTNSATGKGTDRSGGGGASGGGVDSGTNTQTAGGAGGPASTGAVTGAAAGTAGGGAGANGADAKTGSRLPGGGGAGGGSHATSGSAAGAGGNGGKPGGGGGGGGAATGTGTSGKGGDGADGAVYVTVYYN